MLKYIKNAIIPAMVAKTVNIKGDKVFLMKDGSAWAEVSFNGADQPTYVQRHIPHWVK